MKQGKACLTDSIQVFLEDGVFDAGECEGKFVLAKATGSYCAFLCNLSSLVILIKDVKAEGKTAFRKYVLFV